MKMNNTNDRIFTNDNCTGCNRCITACTIPEANVAIMEEGKNKIYVDGTKCIGCAKCIEACPREARDYRDDTELFLERLAGGKEISLIVAPAVRSNFKQFERLLGLFRSMGVKQIYDTSFGADICTWGYLTYMKQHNASGLISQPCPVVVNYIEKHDASLLDKLAPVHSPAMCSAIYMKNYKNISGEYAFLSPCIAKKEEFSDVNTGNLVQYNITFNKLEQALKKRGIDYTSYDPSEFDNQKHGLGCLYPMPGGLKVNVQQNVPDAWVYQVEGQPEVVHFLQTFEQSSSTEQKPLLIDILNCADGCNMGTGALCSDGDGIAVSRAMYEAEKAVLASSQKTTKLKIKKQQQPFPDLNLSDFIRTYENKEVQPIAVSAQGIEDAYEALFKQTKAERTVDCCSCGYSTCDEMARAIAKGINHPENCVEYHKGVLRHRQQEIGEMLDQQNAMSQELTASVGQIFEAISQSSQKAEETVDQLSQINHEVVGVKEIALKLNEMVEALKKQINDYVTLGGQIVKISMQTKLLSMNASVEAAHAKEHGKGFAVLAEEMKKLSDQSAESAKEISSSNSSVLPILDEVLEFSEDLKARTQTILDHTETIQTAVESISSTEQEIAQAAAQLSAQDSNAKTDYMN